MTLDTLGSLSNPDKHYQCWVMGLQTGRDGAGAVSLLLPCLWIARRNLLLWVFGKTAPSHPFPESCDWLWGTPLAWVCLRQPHSRITVSLPGCPLWFILGHCRSRKLSGRISKQSLDLESPFAILYTSITTFNTMFNGFGDFLMQSRLCVIGEQSLSFLGE